MKKNLIKLISILFFLSTIYYLLSTSSKVSAQLSLLPLIVAPARQELTINPGESSTVTIRFYNQQETVVSGIIKAADFIVDNKDGTPRIIDNPVQSSPKYSGTSWFTLPYDRMSIAGGDKVSVQATIDVPLGARPGGRYVAVYFEPSTSIPQAPVGSQESGTMAVSPRIAALVYVRVSGPITEQAQISRLFSQSFYEYGPINIESEILNRGDYHIRPRGVMTLSNMFGGSVTEQKLEEHNIFPDTIRTYENALGRKWMLGRYRVDLTATYGEKNQPITRSMYIWVFPWRVTLIIVLALIILFLIGKNTYNKLVVKETHLEEELAKEKEEIERLKEELHNKHTD